MSADIRKSWIFASESGPSRYETLQYIDGTTSCNCRGWTRKVQSDGSRTCRHVRLVEHGMADQQALSFRDVAADKSRMEPVHNPHAINRSSRLT